MSVVRTGDRRQVTNDSFPISINQITKEDDMHKIDTDIIVFTSKKAHPSFYSTIPLWAIFYLIFVVFFFFKVFFSIMK